MENDLRKPGSKFKQIDWELSSDTFYAEGHGLEGKVPVEFTQQQDPGLDVLSRTTEKVTDKILLNRENNVATALTTLTNYAASNRATLAGSGVAATNQWDYATDAGGDPFTVAKNARTAVIKGVGKLPNTLVLGFPVFEALKLHASVLDRIKYSERGVVTAEILATLFEVERVVVAKAMYDTVKKGQTPVLDYLWGKHALFAYVPPRPAQLEVSLMYTFRWKDAPNATEGVSTVKYWDQSVKSWMTQVDWYYDNKMISNVAGYFVQNAVA